MSIRNFEWNDDIVAHIAGHHVRPEEVEEAFAGKALRLRAWAGRFILLGRTAAGRYLLVAFVMRQGMVRTITARDMTDTEKRRFQRDAI